jgi:hypothetical protein
LGAIESALLGDLLFKDWGTVVSPDFVSVPESNRQLKHALPKLQYILAIVRRRNGIKVILQRASVGILEEYMTFLAVFITSIVADNMWTLIDSSKRCHLTFVEPFGVSRSICLEDECVCVLGTQLLASVSHSS